MKTTIRLAAMAAVLLCAFAPRTYTIELVRETIIANFLGPASDYRKYEASMPVDVDRDLPGVFKLGDYGKTQFPSDQCETSPAYLYYALYISLDSNAYWNYDACVYNKPMTDRFKALFGQDIIKAKIKLAQKDYEGNAIEWRHYRAEGIQAAFDKLYQKPSTKFHGYMLQQIYDFSAKQYARDITDVVVRVMARKADFEKYAKQYLQDAQTKKDFEGQDFSNTVSQELLGTTGNTCIPDEYATRVVGIMLRRQCDGSLPTMLNCLKTVLKDYDAEFFTRVGTKF